MLEVKKNKIVIFIFVLLSIKSFGQRVDITSTEQKGEQIYIRYNLQGNEGKYLIKLFVKGSNSSYWSTPLTHVSGDVGLNQTRGTNKLIIWDVLNEREKLQGDYVFGIEAVNVTEKEKAEKQKNSRIYSTLRKQNGIYIEAGGISIYGSVNYEKYIINKAKLMMATTLGIGLTPSFDFYYSMQNFTNSVSESYLDWSIPIRNNFIFFEGNNHLEIGFGFMITNYWDFYLQYNNKYLSHYNGYVGYRFQRKINRSSWIVRAGVNYDNFPYVYPHGKYNYWFFGSSIGVDF